MSDAFGPRTAAAATGDLRSQLASFGPVVRGAMLRQLSGKRDNCIAASKIGLDILRQARIGDAFALRVELTVFNAAYVKRVEQEGRMPQGHGEIDRWWEECGAWSKGVGITEIPLGPDRWHGHLALIVERKWLWDLSADQASDERRGFAFPEPVLLPVTEAFLRAREPIVATWHNLLLRYAARPDDKSFRDTPDWRTARAEVTRR